MTIQIPDDIEEGFSTEVNDYIISYLELIQNVAIELKFKSTFGYDHTSKEDEMLGVKHEFLYFHIWGTMNNQEVALNVVKIIEGLNGLLNNKGLIKKSLLEFLN
jgi:hypothetical protein